MVEDSSVKTKNGKKIMLYRAHTANGSLSSTQYLPETQFKVGINQTVAEKSDTDLDISIPIAVGVVNDDGTNTLTGGGDASNSTDNTTIYKPGGGVADATGQNLIKTTGASVDANWANTAADTNFDQTKYVGFWLYIADSATLAKFKSSGTCLELRIGPDVTTNYFQKVWSRTSLTIGWNWMYTLVTIENLTEVSSADGTTLDSFQIRVTTENTTDTFDTGELVYDLLRTWDAADTVKDFTTGYPVIDLDNLEVTKRMSLSVVEAAGFNLSGLGEFNEDTSVLMTGEDSFEEASKGDTDEFKYIVRDQLV